MFQFSLLNQVSDGTLTTPGQTVQRTNQPETTEAKIRLAAPFIEKSIVMVNEASFESLGQV